MQDSETKSHVESMTDSESDAEVAERLAWFFETVSSAFSRNTERALRADLRVFLAWCQQRGLAAMPTSAATVAAFIDDMANSRAPATVRRYVPQHRNAPQGASPGEPQGQYGREARSAADVPDPRAQADAGDRAGLTAPEPADRGGGKAADRRAEARTAGP